VCIHALCSVTTGAGVALVNVDLAVRPVKAFMAIASVTMPSGNAVAILSTRAAGAVIDLGTQRSLPAQRTSTRVVGQRLEAASASVSAGAVRARVVGNGYFAERRLVADGTSTLERWSPLGRHDNGARSPVLTFLASGIAGILVLAVFSGESRWTSVKNWLTFSICSG